ncbi:RNA recognition motif (RRM, RBD, or RNP domain) [Novymonas esmeraldas]|uniref:RNA recognition motif (RRM, RBD, or RNP domain) n=1 Tax=Novymonas esmeraldas TaxID=1808958 RepID=A0AAW0FBX0_9TRYP
MSSAHSDASVHVPEHVLSPLVVAPPSSSTAGTLASSVGFAAQASVSPFTTSYKSLPTASNISAASSHTSVKQQSRSEVLARTVHLRCLPPFMKQKILADVFDDCGEYLRVRICGNAATHQKWVYGFVEFVSAEAASKMMTHCGMELPNGPDKPPLRLKCSPSKQPILDCMAYDADVMSSTPCGFGRGYLAECTLNDALLVVGGGGSGCGGSGCGGSGCYSNGGGGGGVAMGAKTPGGASSQGGGGDYRTKAATNALTALTVRSIRKVAATGCGCGCSGVNCCGCCQCWRSTHTGTESTACAGGEISQSETVVDAAAQTASPPAAVGSTGPTADARSLECCSGDGVSSPAAPTVTVSTFAGLHAPPAGAGCDGALDILQQLAAAFQGLREGAATRERQLDGPAIVKQAEAMALEAMYSAGHLASDVRIQDVLHELTQLLRFLDANAAVTGGAAQTASGDCTATLPQRVTQLRMLANLVAALLCLLRRSVGDAVLYVEAVLVCFAQIPPSTLLLRARQHDKAVAAQAHKTKDHHVAAPSRDCRGASRKRCSVSSLALGAYVDEDVAGPLLDMMDDDDDGGLGGSEGSHTDDAWIHHVSSREVPAEGYEEQEEDEDGSAAAAAAAAAGPAAAGLSLKDRSASVASSSDASAAFLNSADMADLCRRDEAFTRYVLNVVVSIGLSMEEVHPVIARSAYTLANARAAEVFGEANALLADRLASSPATCNPRLCAALFAEAAKSGNSRDIAFFPHQFFESVRTVRQRVRDTRGTECFWRQLPPNHVVMLFRA